MSVAQGIFPKTEVPSAFQTYRLILLVSIVANIAVALGVIIVPYQIAETIGLAPSEPIAWMPYSGMMILALTGSYLPVLVSPQASPFMGFYTGVLRFFLVVFFLIVGGGFIWYAVYDGIFGVLLLASYYRAYNEANKEQKGQAEM